MRRVGSVPVPSRYLSRPGAASPHGRLPARCRPSAPQGAAPPCAAGREEPGQPREPGTGRGPSGIGRDRAGSGRASAALPARRPGASPAGTQLGSSPPGAARGAPGGTSQGKQNEGINVEQYNQHISSQESCGAIENGSIHGQNEVPNLVPVAGSNIGSVFIAAAM
eukprot:XP_027309564.1 guanine nucleotide-binding protein G(I)/G(S)/G(O) subunit gamma-4 isoform X1 [Anas platyrhynchos]